MVLFKKGDDLVLLKRMDFSSLSSEQVIQIMKKLIIIVFLFSLPLAAQLRLTIDTDKDVYEYGEEIRIFCTLYNDDDTTVTFFASDYSSCQAEFILNQYDSYYWGACLPTVQEINFLPHSERIYSWTIDPHIYGIPDTDGEQTLIGYFRPGWNTFSVDHLKDTTTFYAPSFLGGQLDVGFVTEKQSVVDSIRESYRAELIDHTDFLALGESAETWQILGMHIDSAKSQLEQINVFEYVSYKRMGLMYDSIYVTSVRKIDEVQNLFSLSQNYPNPFNPSTTIKFTIPSSVRRKTQDVKLTVYDILGRKVQTLLNKKLTPGSYEVKFNGNNFSSGVYFYKVTAGEYIQTKKMLLMK